MSTEVEHMTVDVVADRAFIPTHASALDRCCCELRDGDEQARPEIVVRAGGCNPDGVSGWRMHAEL